MRRAARCAVLLACALLFQQLRANGPTKGDPIPIARSAGPIRLDGELDDPGWKVAPRVESWFETSPADNVPAKVRNVGYLVHDEKYLYAAFEFFDPDPRKIHAPFGDRDALDNYTDYGGLILDTKGDGKTATLFLANARGLQYDAVSDDSSGNEDSSPDFYWDAAGKITATGWQLEIRIPFSSLRYPKADIQRWNVLLFRNYPRDFRTQLFSARLPRGENCFVCHAGPLEGLAGLPAGGGLVAAPYATARQEAYPENGPGTPLANDPVRFDGGLDVKWTPNAVTAFDGTINPDFSQIESDVAQISANERFALFYPEKRPFFLEGIELFSTPLQAVYTRTITSPRWGLRGTGRFGTTSYTALVAADRGGGSVILPGPEGSEFADQDFESLAAIGRVRHDIGRSFVSFLITDREVKGGGYNRVFGPDFQWRPRPADTLTGQVLISSTQDPNRPDLAPQWTGQTSTSHAADIWYNHATATFDFFAEYKDIGKDFRADDGFIPQAGFRENYVETGYTFRPKTGPVSRLRVFALGDYTVESSGSVLGKLVSPGFGFDGILKSSGSFRLAFDEVRTGGKMIPRTQFIYSLSFSPSMTIARLTLNGYLGDQIDFAGSRPGTGGKVAVTASIRPTHHLELALNGELRWLDVAPVAGGEKQRLFTAQVERVKATYNFSSKSYLRLIAQWVRLEQDPALAAEPVESLSGTFSASALFAYKLNWQTVLFLGYGDNRALDEDGRYDRTDRQLFLKVSYAFQR